MLETALRYIARGWKVFPLHSIDQNGCCTCGKVDCSDAGKHPRSRRGGKDASGDEAAVREWFGPGAPLSNIGVATGAVSGITVIDIDTANGKPGAETWTELTREAGEPATLVAQTGSGGLHFYFKFNAALKTSTNTLGPGIDCRNDGGYVVAPPSSHRSGCKYEWINEAPLADLPFHLLKKKEKRGRPKKGDLTRGHYTIAQVRDMLSKVDASDREYWYNFGIVLGRTFERSAEAWELYVEWAATWKGTPGRNHDEIMRGAFYEKSTQSVENDLSMGTIVRAAIDGGWAPKFGEVPVSNFIFYGPGNNFIYRPNGSFWVSEAVNSGVSPINETGKITKASDWLRLHALATSMTNDPMLDGDFISGVDFRDGEPLKTEGGATFNSYRPPSIEAGDPRMAKPWFDHVRLLFQKDGDADQFINYLAHRVQSPGEKPRFALLIAGDQGVGKDTAVDFACPAIGRWNVTSIDPSALDSGFNEFATAVLIRINEAANLHDMNKWAFNERLKVLIAGTPDHSTINPKYGQKYSVRLHCGIILTTNHMLGGIYIPQDDRRYDVLEAARKDEMGLTSDEKAREYFSELWDWYNNERGGAHVAAFLQARDISKWSASNGQRKTEAHRSVVTVNLSSDHWLFDIMNELGEPAIVRSDTIMSLATRDGASVKEVAVKMQPAMARCGYRVQRNPERADGRYRFDSKLATVYVKFGAPIDPRELGSGKPAEAEIDRSEPAAPLF